ncbi:DUF3536 domain-containing protein [Planktothrix pseudagardhii]|uniref:Glycoside hydrolase family 57 N-terminal domain-containing protein n=1 Tax=Planktothrix pseudagardhii TaxID=132604 RepID=A0A9W4CTC5_9CYAN|nr:DUF3536 domain-containing protein [Planktothrix pseudagardhii]CAD5969281.1 hypothetical protein NO713_03711 [Planktothrix pseudagardhii]
MVSTSNFQVFGIADTDLNFAGSEFTQPPEFDSPSTATGVYVTIHGHFYQPPRENPYLNVVERQSTAAPYHNWNERIHHECYRPNAFARILNDRGEVVGIVNNYEYLSFNIGPTLMSWLERYDMEVYQKILEADRKSCQRLNGHGNAIAQVYNHIIMPLANERDKYTQIRWAKADFRSRFGRDPEGLWLAETAIDYATLEVLVNEGIRFTILAPSQAERCRPFATSNCPEPEWQEVGGSQIDTTRPYRCYLQDKTGAKDESRYLDIFFYDGPISRDMGFNDVLNSSHHLSGRIRQAVRGDHRPTQLISVATDGETFGHHRGGTEKCLAYAFVTEFPQNGWTVTNFAHYLSLYPPTWEVQLKPVTAWSCSHGVDRWQDDCGCASGGGWHQQWRRPLRDTLNGLRDRLIEIYDQYGCQFFHDPWVARDHYIQVIRNRSDANINAFFAQHQTHDLTHSEQVDALRLLEMQRHCLLMFTSCGWFFEELSRPEGVQVLCYASRAIELAAEVAGVELETEFIFNLALAPSNVELFKTGDEVYRQLVTTARVSLKQVAAHYAITSLFTTYQREQRLYCYKAQQLDYQMQRMGSLNLAVGEVLLVSEITREQTHFVFAVFHLGGWDFHCCIQPFSGRRSYFELKRLLFEALQEASAAHLMLRLVQSFGDDSFSLRDLFAEERQRIMGLLCHETLTRLDQLYTQVYRDNYGIMMAFHRDELAVPPELQVATEVALGNRFLSSVRALESESSEGRLSINHLGELEAIAKEAQLLRCRLQHPEVKESFERLIIQFLWRRLQDHDLGTIAEDLQNLQRLIQLNYNLNLGVSLNQAQEFYFQYLKTHIIPLCLGYLQRNHQEIYVDFAENNNSDTRVAVQIVSEGHTSQLHQIRRLLQLGQTLGLDVQEWLNLLG